MSHIDDSPPISPLQASRKSVDVGAAWEMLVRRHGTDWMGFSSVADCVSVFICAMAWFGVHACAFCGYGSITE